MQENAVELVQSTFAQVAPIADKAAAMFYARLFEIAPEVRPLFKADLTEQGAKLMQMIGTAVASLTNLDALVPVAQDLAKRHIDYGVTKAHYAVVGDALIWTLEQGLGDAFTAEVKQAWVDVYGLLSSVMIEAAYD
ncbi:globin family protein [Catenovulum agarivorans]|uniref:globin family protein n=1 Tax=Catenovulum agarivorans TaxID=1172192 RepID=UPI00030259AB|nr:globin family protein [Catenovulum agarivorans]